MSEILSALQVALYLSTHLCIETGYVRRLGFHLKTICNSFLSFFLTFIFILYHNFSKKSINLMRNFLQCNRRNSIGTLSPKTDSHPGGRQEIRTLLLICGISIVYLLGEFEPFPRRYGAAGWD